MQSFQELVVEFENHLAGKLGFPATPQQLYDPLRYFLGLGGKRVRPVLCLMGNELFGNIEADAWHGASGIELFHNFTLIHDDIMDNAPLRRGKPTIHEQHGLTTGILSGDVLCIYAYQQFSKIGQRLQPILARFNKTAIEVCEGQQMDMDFEQRSDVRIDEYIRMIELKTSVLLACALEIGALIGGATQGNAEKLYAFGKHLGIAFQLQDDYLDAFGDMEMLGKQHGGDIKANKKTYLLLKALGNANAAQRSAIEALLAGNAPDKVPRMLQLFEDTGAATACRDAVQHYSDQAFHCLEEVAVIRNRKKPLLELAQYLLQRQS